MQENASTTSTDDCIAAKVVDAAFRVHRELGPGLLESAYEACLAYELRQRGIVFQQQVAMPITYRTLQLQAGYRIDLVVEGRVLVEIKAVQELQPTHAAQVLTYLRLSSRRIGLLINFNTRMFKSGIRRLVCDSLGESGGEAI